MEEISKSMNVQEQYLFPTVIMNFDLTAELSNFDFNLDNFVGDSHYLVENGTSNYNCPNWLATNNQEYLLNIFQQCVDTYTNRLQLMPCNIVNIWMNNMTVGSRVLAHRHEGSVLSGAFYPKLADNSAALRFNSPLTPYRMNDLFTGENELNTYFHYAQPKEMNLVLFPSWLEHETTVNQSEYRYVISFNTARES